MSLVQTLMQPLRAQYMGSLDKNELRPSSYGGWDFFNTDNRVSSGIFTNDIRSKIKKSFNQTVQVPVIDFHSDDIQITNVRSCTVADMENTSKLITLSFATYAFGFTMYPSQYENNDIKRQEDFNIKMRLFLLKLASLLDAQAIAHLEANKNIFWTNIAGSPYAQVGNALQVTQAQKNDFYNQAEAIMARMDFYGNPKVIKSPHGRPMVRRLGEQGPNNSVNEQFQLAPYEWFWTNRLVPGAGVESVGFLVQEGSVALETRLDFDSMAGHRIGDQIQWGTVNLPIPNSPFGIKAGSFYRKDCADGSNIQEPNTGVQGNTATLKESFSFSFDICLASAYNSDMANRYHPIVKFEISNA